MMVFASAFSPMASAMSSAHGECADQHATGGCARLFGRRRVLMKTNPTPTMVARLSKKRESKHGRSSLVKPSVAALRAGTKEAASFFGSDQSLL